MKITRSQLSQIIMEELNETDALAYFRAQTDKDPMARQNTDAVFYLEAFFNSVKAAYDDDDADKLRAIFERGWDNEAKEITGPLAMIEQLAKIDPPPEGIDRLAEMLEEVDARWVDDRDLYGATGKVDGYLTRDGNLEEIIRLIKGIYPATTVDVESDEPTTWADRTMAIDPSRSSAPKEPQQFRVEPPKPFREGKITPTQLKQLLLEEAGNCTEPQHVIFSIVKDMDPNDVAELFQDVFEQLPGVEMIRADPEAEEEPIPTSYQPGGELGDRPVVGFKEQLLEMIRQELGENTYMDRLKSGDISAHGRNVAASQRRALMDMFKDFGGSVGPETGGIRYITFTDRATAMKAYAALKDRVGRKDLRLTIPHVQPKTGYKLRLEGP